MKLASTIIERGNNSFGLLRLAAALLVVLSHAMLVGQKMPEDGALLLGTNFTLGSHAVHMFFVLSGFLIAAAWTRSPDIAHFVSGRVARIMPALVVITLVVLIVSAFVQNEQSAAAFLVSADALLFFVRTALIFDGGAMLPGIFETNPFDNSIMPTVWTIHYEVLCYVAVPIFALLGLFRPKVMPWTIVGVLTASGLYLVTHNGSYHHLGYLGQVARFVFAFYLGIGAWYIRSYLPLTLLCLLGTFSLLILTISTPLATLTQIFFTGYLTLYLGSFNFGPVTNVTERIDLSYGIYVMGYPIQQIWVVMFDADTHTASLNFALTLAVIIPLSYISWTFIEKPALERRKLLTKVIRRFIPNSLSDRLNAQSSPSLSPPR